MNMEVNCDIDGREMANRAPKKFMMLNEKALCR